MAQYNKLCFNPANLRINLTLCSLLFLLTFLFSKQSDASHISGLNISYECVGGDDYLITINVFRACQDQNPLPDSLNVFIASSCFVHGYEAFAQISVSDVSQLCAAELPNSKCSGGFQPGVQLGVYQLLIALEPCIDWKIMVSEQNRDNAIVNLVDPSTFSLYVEAFLNNSNNECNNSPKLSLINLPYTCVGVPLHYNLGFIDADGDSLSYALVPAQASETPNAPFELNYLPAYSGSEPIPGMAIDPVTGQIEVTPMQIGKFNAVVQVKEYRNGILIGIVSYDFMFLVNMCAIPPPAPVPGSLANVSGGGYPLDENTIGICANDDFCFQIAFDSPDPGINISLTSNINLLFPGAIESVSGSNPAVITFCGSLPPNFNGGSFIITAIDDACPVYGQAFYSIDFAFRKPIKAFNDTVICLGQSANLSAINDTTYTWESLSTEGSPYGTGNILAPGDGISCNPCQQTIVSPDTSTKYIVRGLYANSSCANTDTVTVHVPLRTSVNTSDESCTGEDGVIDIDVLTGSGDYDVLWNDLGEGPLSRNDLTAGEYQVLIIDNVYGCSRIDTFNLIQWDPPTANAGSDFEICGLSADLAAVPSYGNASWSNAGGATFSTGTLPTTSVSVPIEGTYPLVWTEDAGIGCVESDTVHVTFYALPSAQILAEDSICGLVTGLSANVQNGSPEWNTDPGVTLSQTDILNPDATSQNYGLKPIYLTVQNGICTDRDTVQILFIEIPVSNAGLDAEFCGLVGNLSAIDGLGEGVWNLPATFSPQGDPTNENLQVESSSYGFFEAVRSLTNLNFCLTTDTTTIRFTESPIVDLGTDIAVCDSITQLSFSLPIGILEWELSPNLSELNSIETPTTFSGSFGTHQAILRADNGYGCIDSDTLNLNFVVQPLLQFVLSDTICGLNYSLNGEIIADNQFWLADANVTFTDLFGSTSDVTVSTEGNYTFYWVAENGGFCRDTTAVPVTFYDQPITDAGEDRMVCGLGTNLSAISSYGIFLWQDLPGLTFSNAISPGSSILADWYGSYTITAREKNGICSDSDQVAVKFISTPEIQNPQWECTQTDAQFLLTFQVSLGDTSAYEIQGLTGTLSDFLFTSDPLTSDTPIQAILYDNGYCGGDTITGTKFCPIITNAGLMSPDTIRLCGNNLVVIGGSIDAELDGNDTLLYAFHNGSASSLGTIYEWSEEPNFSFGPELTYDSTYYISAVAGNILGNGIDLNDPQLSVASGTPIEFYQPPQGFIDGSFTICPYDTVWIPVEMSGAMPQQLIYSVGNMTFSDTVYETGFEITASDSGAVQLISTASEFCNGDVAGSAEVHYHGLPQASISGPGAICEGDTALMEIHFEGEAPFAAVLTQDGVEINTLELLTESLAFSTLTGGGFALMEISDHNCAAANNATTHLTVKPLPEVDAGPDLTLCDGDTVLLGAPALSGQTYAWSNATGMLSNQTAQVYFAASINSPFPQSLTVNLVTELNGCFATDLLVLEINPVPVPQIVGKASICSGDSISLIGFGGDSYAWQPSAYFAHPGSIQSLFSAPTDTQVSLTAISEAGCLTTIQKLIQVIDSPDSLFAISETSGCAPFEFQLNAFSAEAGDQYQWKIGTRDLTNDVPYLTTTIDKPGIYDLILNVTATNGCTAEMTWPEPIRVYSTSALFSVFPDKPDITHPEIFFRNLSPFDVESEWTFDTLATAQTRNAQYTFPAFVGGHYEVCLTVNDSNACTAKYCETVKLGGAHFVYVPSAFTPNGDGLNDLFYPVLANVDVAEYHFWITNSRGEIVFDTHNPNDKWNGTDGEPKYYGENKIYNWHLVVKPDFNVETEYQQGSVMLIR